MLVISIVQGTISIAILQVQKKIKNDPYAYIESVENTF